MRLWAIRDRSTLEYVVGAQGRVFSPKLFMKKESAFRAKKRIAPYYNRDVGEYEVVRVKIEAMYSEED